MHTKPSILILCTGNSCRSQMAEGFLREAVGNCAYVYSAGSKPAGYIHPLAIRVMHEVGIELTPPLYHSKSWNDFLDKKIATVITVCGNADQACPHFPGVVRRYHWGFIDPAHAAGSDDEILLEFRQVRDRIKQVFEAYGAGLREGMTSI